MNKTQLLHTVQDLIDYLKTLVPDNYIWNAMFY